MENKIKAAIIGVTGYAGQELFRLLRSHPAVEVIVVTSKSYADKKLADVYECYRNLTDITCVEGDLARIAEMADVVFIALPHGIASNLVTEDILKKTKIIDLGADFRLKNLQTYEQWYDVKHENSHLLDESVYGLCELHREEIKTARLVANPGCYTTCSILSLYPLIKENIIDESSIIIDAKSGVTGAGRALSLGISYCECNESIKAYKIASHRHTPEIEQELSLAAGKQINLTFTPHLTPMNRGILATTYAKLTKKVTCKDLRSIYEKYYGNEFFVRLLPEGIFPETKWTKGSNFVDIGFAIDERTNNVIVIGAIDNLIKGAAGQAVQNMNILFGQNERTAIDTSPLFPV